MIDDENFELRKKFIDLLQKLTNNDTKDYAYNQLKKLIKENSSDKSLRVYLNSLMTFNTKSISAKEKIIILFGFLANIYRTNLLDPLDSPKSLTKTINRIISHFRNNCFKDNDYVIQKACSYSILELLNLCMDKNDRDNLNKIFVEPFIYNIVNHSNAYIKNGCCVYLNDLIFLIKDKSKSSLIILDLILNENQFLNDVIIKLNVNQYENEYLYECLYNLINFFPFEYFEKKIQIIVNKMLQILDKKNNLKPGTIINCINILGLIGKKIKKRNIQLENFISLIQLLTNYNCHRNKNVRESVKKTLNILNNNKEKNEEDKSTSELSEFIEQKYNINSTNQMHKYTFNKNLNNKLPKLNERRIEKYNKNNLISIKDNNLFDFKYENKFEGNNLNPDLNPVKNNKNLNFNLSKTEIYSNINDNEYIFKMIDLSDIMDKFKSINKNLLDYEKKINIKLYRIKNRINKVNNSIENNLYNIYKSHNNILDETFVDNEKKDNYILSLNYLNNNDYEKAFENILGDDIYLIRLLILSRTHLDNLKVSKELFKKIILRLNKINKSHFIENIIFNAIQYLDSNIIKNQNNLLGNELINTMNEIHQYKNEIIQSKAIFFTNLIYNMYNH